MYILIAMYAIFVFTIYINFFYFAHFSGNNPTIAESKKPNTKFRIVQAKNQRITLVLDVSGSMAQSSNGVNITATGCVESVFLLALESLYHCKYLPLHSLVGGI